MHGEMGTAVGAVWDALNTRGELKKAVKGKEPTFDWAIGWPIALRGNPAKERNWTPIFFRRFVRSAAISSICAEGQSIA